MSDFHPTHWDPAWTVSNILLGVQSFMLEDSPTYGSIETSDANKRQLALQSLKFNAEKTDEWFSNLFPDIFALCTFKPEDKKEAKGEETTTSGDLHAAVEMPEDEVDVRQMRCACQPSDLTTFLIPLVIFPCILLFLIVLAFVLVI